MQGLHICLGMVSAILSHPLATLPSTGQCDFFEGLYAGNIPPCQSFQFPPPNNNKVIPVDTKLHRGMAQKGGAQKGGSEKPPNVIPDT